MKRRPGLGILLGAIFFTVAASAQRRGNATGESNARLPTLAFRTEVPVHAYDLVLGRPTKDSIVLSVLAYEDFRAMLYCGQAPDRLKPLGAAREFRRGEPVELVMDHLEPDTRYTYELRPANPTGSLAASGPRTFSTARAAGSAFTFCVQADSHLDFGTDVGVYIKSLNLAAASRPDFFVDLGDTFMTDKRNDYRAALPQYFAQRYYLGLIGRAAPVFLVLGNHDGEQPWRGRDGEAMAAWSLAERKKFFPNPDPNDFYSGDTLVPGGGGSLQDYYAFEWGDALFVVLDPFRFSTGRSRETDNWGRSLGRLQYDWLERRLATSHARFKFVFLHNLVGGSTPESRGGVEASGYYEWGGRDANGRQTFARHRPGWGMPIHDLLVKHGVTIVFHGHDHFYARQERDGVVYQLVPQPGHQRADNLASADDYGYKTGVRQGASGFLRVTVSSESTVVEYVRAYPANAEGAGRESGTVSHRYEIPAR